MVGMQALRLKAPGFPASGTMMTVFRKKPRKATVKNIMDPQEVGNFYNFYIIILIDTYSVCMCMDLYLEASQNWE